MLSRYSDLLQFSSAQDLNSLEDEFLRYQILKDTDTPEHVWKEALVVEDKEQDTEKNRKYRMDVIWSYLSTLKNIDGNLMFKRCQSSTISAYIATLEC